LLLEVLIAIALFLAVSTIIAQALFAGFSGGRNAQVKTAMSGVAAGQIAMARALADEHWDNIGGLSRNTPYHITSSSSGFAIAPGIKEGVADGFPYAVSFQIADGVREVSSSTAALSLDQKLAPRSDSGTLLVTCVASSSGVEPITMTAALTRWRNVVCGQGGWIASSSNQAVPCETGNINLGAKSNIETGDQLKLCNGCL
jgi:type II secretory pathway pseudopilin PulG